MRMTIIDDDVARLRDYIGGRDAERKPVRDREPYRGSPEDREELAADGTGDAGRA